MDFKLEVNQNLKLILSLDMKMSIEILKMSTKELKEFLEKESKKNPVIDISYPTKNYTKNTSQTDFLLDSLEGNEKNLIDYLEEQIGYLSINLEMKNILYFLINNLDERGYLVGGLDEFKKVLKVNKIEIIKGIEILHSLEPVGIGGKDLIECLLIQLKLKNIKNEILENIIKNDLEDIAEGRLESISKKYSIDLEKLNEILKVLKTLNPKPARGFIVNNKIEYIIPDIIVFLEKEELRIELNEEYCPKIKIKRDGSDNKNITKAIALITAIEKRQNTLLKISRYILTYQKDNILYDKDLKTLKIKDIAYELDYHESTVSRAINEKYLKINGKIKKLKDYILLSSEREKLKFELLFLIKNEDKFKPLSDEKLVEKIQEKGFKINRRTITKYRLELGIESSRKRKKVKS